MMSMNSIILIATVFDMKKCFPVDFSTVYRMLFKGNFMLLKYEWSSYIYQFVAFDFLAFVISLFKKLCLHVFLRIGTNAKLVNTDL